MLSRPGVKRARWGKRSLAEVSCVKTKEDLTEELDDDVLAALIGVSKISVLESMDLEVGFCKSSINQMQW